MDSFFYFIFSQYRDYSPFLIFLELIASSFGLISVLLVRRGSVWAFGVGLISTGLYVYLLWQWQLFGDMLINGYYSIMGIYGWINWSKNKSVKQNTIEIQKTTLKEWMFLSVLALISFIFVTIIYYFKPWINNNFNFNHITLGFSQFIWTDYFDILTTGLFLVAMLLMAKRKIEHWIIWIIADMISVPLYFYKGMIFTSLQYILFTIIAFMGLYSWRKLVHHDNYLANTKIHTN